MPELAAENLACGHGARTVLKDLTFTVKSGDFFFLLGPNGAGKTTLLKTLLRLVKPKAGRVLLDGEDVSRYSARQFAARVAYVPQAHTPPFPYSLLDMVAMGRASRQGFSGAPSRLDIKIAEEALETLSISHLKDTACTEISGGERQLALIARALAQKPDFLIMDEPTSNLDFGNQIAVLGHASRLAKEGRMGIAMTTHDPNHALFHASTVLAIGPEGACTLGAPVQVVTGDYLYATYGISPHSVQTRLEDGQEARVFLPVHKSRERSGVRKGLGRLVAVGLLGLAIAAEGIAGGARAADAPTPRTVIDMTGRSVELPAKVERIACLEVLCYQKLLMLGAASRATVMTKTSAPWMLLTNPGAAAIEMIPPEPDFEDLLLKRVDVAFFAYNADRTLKKLESLGITGLVSQPVGRTARTAEEFLADAKRSVRLFGEVLGGEAEHRAEEWCRDLDRRAAFVSEQLAGLPAERRLKVFYVRGPSALNTQGTGSNTFWYGKLGGANMVIENQPLAGKGATSMEDLVRWNPDVVLVGRQYPLDLVLKDERWAGITAVKTGRVYSTPEGVFYWDGGPEGVLLMEFVAKLLYPDRFAGLDMVAEVQNYYARYYRFQLSAGQAALLLQGRSPDGSRLNPVNN